MKKFDKYLSLYPEQERLLWAAMNLWGEDATLNVIGQALNLGKKIKFLDPKEGYYDLLEYKLVKP